MLYTFQLLLAATAYITSPVVQMSGLNLVGSANTAMTIETSAAPAGTHTSAFVGAFGTTTV